MKGLSLILLSYRNSTGEWRYLRLPAIQYSLRQASFICAGLSVLADL